MKDHDAPHPAATCWLHPDVDVRVSAIEGNGLFAKVPIAAGVAVSRVGGRLVTDDELARIFAEATEYVDTISVSAGTNLVLPASVPNRFGNHSCDPNLWWVDAFTLATRRAIAADQELTSDYGTSTNADDFEMTCRCGAAQCRGRVTGLDWQLPELCERYGAHWVPSLLDHIADR